jgi:undecaprenyl-diphosphatase
MTPASFYRSRGSLLVGIGLLLSLLALSAGLRHGALALQWDLPIQRFVEEQRGSNGDTFFRAVSRLGSTVVVIGLTTTLTIATWWRCRAVSLVILAAALARPALEYVLKAGFGRDRPDLVRLVGAHGPSFPSGHVLAAIALYGLLPLVVGLYTRRRGLWWASFAVAVLLIGLIAASRVYLGVHWFSDVTASLLLGSFFLLGVEAFYRRLHDGASPCKR